MTIDTRDKYRFCKITAANPKTLSKGFYLTPEEELAKSQSGLLCEGRYEVVEINGPKDFSEVLDSLTPSDALTFGLPKHQEASGKIFSRKNAKQGDLTRTRDHFEFKSEPSIIMIDIDDKNVTIDEVKKALADIIEGFDNAPIVIANSASTYIYNGDTQLVGDGGKRIYIFGKDGKDIERVGKVISQRLMLNGHFRFEISKSGSLLERTMIDTAVFQPERLDYAGGAYCQPPLVQRRPKPIVLNDGAEPLDTRRAIKSLNVDEMNDLANIKREAKLKIAIEQKGVRAKWVLECIQKMEKAEQRQFNDAERDSLRTSLTDASEKGFLYGDFVLYPEKGDPVTVGELLDNIDKWHGTKFADPLEPDYRNDNRIAWANLKSGGRPYIWSYAHGGKRYTLIRPSTQLEINKGDFPRLVDDVLSIMRVDSMVYEQSRSLVRVAGNKIERVDDAWLRNYIEQIVRFYVSKETKEGFTRKPQHCPLDVSKRIASLYGSWNLKQLKSVINLPIMRYDGSVLDQLGYDESTQLLLVNDDYEKFPTISMNPTEDEVKASLERIWKPFSLFPFNSETDRGVLLAALLSIVIRPVLETNPGFLFRSATFGSGKTLLALCIEAAANASRSIMAWPDQQAEQRKSLISVLQTAPSIVILDNLIGKWNSPDLAAIFTSGVFGDRKLGHSESIEVVTKSLIIGTGNNVIPAGDLSRRILTCNLDPGQERPDKRDFPWNPIDLIKENIIQYRVDLLTVLRGYYSAGCPAHATGKFGSFDEWERIVRQTICWIKDKNLAPVSIDDPLSSIDENFDEDPETEKLRILLINWYEQFADKNITIAALLAEVKNSMQEYSWGPKINSNLVNVVKEICYDRKGELNSKLMGAWVKRNKNRIIDGFCLDKTKTKVQGIYGWYVRKLGVSGV